MDIITRVPFTDKHLIDARLASTTSLFDHEVIPTDADVNQEEKSSLDDNGNMTKRSLPVLMKLVSTSLLGTTIYTNVYQDITSDKETNNETKITNDVSIPTLVGVARKLARVEGTQMDDKQYVAYEVLCCTFLLDLIKDANDPDSDLYSHLQEAISARINSSSNKELIEELKVRGGHDQLIMFLSGPAGAGKSTATKAAWQFCFEFCHAVGTLWSDASFLFTAYTGAAAMAVGGLTICKAAFILSKKKNLSEEDKQLWRQVRILIIDEISFMNDEQFNILDERLKEMKDRNKPFGGYSVVFAGDFRQLEPNGAKSNDLLFSKQSSQLWERVINVVLILKNEHRFKNDSMLGKMLTTMWKDDLPRKWRIWLNNNRLVGPNLQLPKTFPSNKEVSYAAPYNKDRNAISAGNFRNHILATHPPFLSNEQPPKHTIVIEANIKSTKNSRRRLDSVLRHMIITTCGDSNVMSGHKHVDPALCLYKGAYLICTIGNEHLSEKVPRGNGTLCRLVSMKIKSNATSETFRKWYGKKVRTVKAEDVAWIECEHVIKTDGMIRLEKELQHYHEQYVVSSNTKKKRKWKKQMKTIESQLLSMSATRRFKLQPKTNTVSVKVKPFCASKLKINFRCKMTQLPVNLNDATTGHKLQGSSKDVLIITSWPSGGLFKNWEYTVLSRVRTLDGLYLLKPISLEKSFKPSVELKNYLARATRKQDAFLKHREARMAEFYKQRSERQK